jgi:hypothetical protein
MYCVRERERGSEEDIGKRRGRRANGKTEKIMRLREEEEAKPGGGGEGKEEETKKRTCMKALFQSLLSVAFNAARSFLS